MLTKPLQQDPLPSPFAAPEAAAQAPTQVPTQVPGTALPVLAAPTAGPVGSGPVPAPGVAAAPFHGMFDGPAAAAPRTAAGAPAAVAPAAVLPPHNGYVKEELAALYPDQLGYTANDRKYKDIDFWVNRIASGEGGFKSAEDLGDGGKLSTGILQWTQDSGRLGKLMTQYQQAAHRENQDALFDKTFGAQKPAQTLLNTLTGAKPDSVAPSAIKGEFQAAGGLDTFKRAQIEMARTDTRGYLQGVSGMVPHGEDGAVSGKQLAAALIMNNIGPNSPTQIFKAVDDQMYSGIKNQRPDVGKQLGLRTQADQQTYQQQHADELAAMSPAQRSQALAPQLAQSKLGFYNGLAGKYGDVSAQANQQTEAALSTYEKDHNLDPQNPQSQDQSQEQIAQARADIGIQQYSQLVAKGPTIGQRLEATAKAETDQQTTQQMTEYDQSHAAQLAPLNPAQRAKAEAAQRAKFQAATGGQVHAGLVQKAVQDNVAETDYDNRLVTEAPKQLYGTINYLRFHKGLENRLRDTMGTVDPGMRVDTAKL